MPNGFSYPYLLDESISNFGVVGDSFHFNTHFKIEQTGRFAQDGGPYVVERKFLPTRMKDNVLH